MIHLKKLTPSLCCPKLPLAAAALFCLHLISASPAQAQSFQDGQGAVDYDESASSEATPRALPQKIENTEQDSPSSSRRGFRPHVGRQAAQKYMGQTPSRDISSESEGPRRLRDSRPVVSTAEHFLAVHLGLFTSDVAYKWGSEAKTKHPGNYNFGVTYRLGEWVNSMDLNVRVDFSEYSIREGISSKFSFLPMITFPDVKSRFPLYFGVGAGLGVFMHQVDDESSLALEYQIIGGLRFFDILPNTGFFLEAGLKNHLLLLTDGQFNGPFVALGSVFMF